MLLKPLPWCPIFAQCQTFTCGDIFFGLVSIIMLISDIFILQNFGTEQILRTCKHKSTYDLSDQDFFFQNDQNNNMEGDG